MIEKDCENCAWSILFGEDEICVGFDLQEDVGPIAEGSTECDYWTDKRYGGKQTIIDKWYKSTHRNKVVENHWESLVGPINELGDN